MTKAAATVEGRGWRDVLLPVSAVAGLIAVTFGLVFLADQKGGANLLASIYDLVGNPGGARELRNGFGDQSLAKLLMAAVAISIGVGGVWLFYAGLNALIERVRQPWRRRLLPWVFVGPALALLTIFLVYPAVATFATSLSEGGGLKNYGYVVTDRSMLAIFRNNLIWLIVGTAGSVGLGLLIAGLVDRVKHESAAKTFIFLPLASAL